MCGARPRVPRTRAFYAPRLDRDDQAHFDVHLDARYYARVRDSRSRGCFLSRLITWRASGMTFADFAGDSSLIRSFNDGIGRNGVCAPFASNKNVSPYLKVGRLVQPGSTDARGIRYVGIMHGTSCVGV